MNPGWGRDLSLTVGRTSRLKQQAGRSNEVRLFLILAAVVAGIVIVSGRPFAALVLVVYGALALAVALDGRLAYFLLPLTIPWGSALPLALGGAAITPSDLLVAALVASWLVEFVPDHRLDFPDEPWLFALSILIVAMLVSTLGALSLGASGREIVKWVEALAVAALAPRYLRSGRDVWIVVVGLIASASAEAILGLSQFLTHTGPKAFEFHHRFLRAYGTFGQPNPLAGYLNMVLPVALAFAFVKRNAWLWLATLVIGACSLATLSRAGWVAGGLAVLIVCLYYLPWLRPLAVGGALAVIGFVLLAAMSILPLEPLTKLATSLGLTGISFAHHTHANFSEIERAAHWVAGIRMFEAHPFIGVGIGNFAAAYPAYHVAGFLAPLGHAHDYFINIAAEAGIFGFLAYTLFVMMGFKLCVSQARRSTTPSFIGALAVGALGLWTSSTFHNLFDVLYVHELTLLIAVVMGGLIAMKRMAPLGIEPEPPALIGAVP